MGLALPLLLGLLLPLIYPLGGVDDGGGEEAIAWGGLFAPVSQFVNIACVCVHVGLMLFSFYFIEEREKDGRCNKASTSRI